MNGHTLENKKLQEMMSEESVRSTALALLFVCLGQPEEMGNVFSEIDMTCDNRELITGLLLRTFDGREWKLTMELR